MADIRWPTVFVLPILLIATYLNLYWVWGILFVYWAVQAIRFGEAFLVEPIQRDEYPILFWLITAMWIGFGLWAIVADLAWRFS